MLGHEQEQLHGQNPRRASHRDQRPADLHEVFPQQAIPLSRALQWKRIHQATSELFDFAAELLASTLSPATRLQAELPTEPS